MAGATVSSITMKWAIREALTKAGVPENMFGAVEDVGVVMFGTDFCRADGGVLPTKDTNGFEVEYEVKYSVPGAVWFKSWPSPSFIPSGNRFSIISLITIDSSAPPFSEFLGQL